MRVSEIITTLQSLLKEDKEKEVDLMIYRAKGYCLEKDGIPPIDDEKIEFVLR